MPRKKKVVTTEIVEERDPALQQEVSDFVEVTEGDMPPDLQGFLEEIGADATKVVLFRRTKDGKQPYVGTYSAAEFDLEAVKQEHGGGSYFCRIYNQGGVKKTYRFAIDESIKPLAPELRGGSSVRDVLLEKLLERLGGNGGGGDPMEIAAKIAQANATQTAATLALVMPLIEKISGGGKGGNNIAEMLEIMEFGISHFGAGAKDEGFMGVVREVGLPLVDILKNATKGAMQKPVAVAVPVAGAITSGAPLWVGVVRKHVMGLLPYIQGGADPVMVAAAMEVQTPKFVRWLDGMVEDVNFRPQLFANVPELGPHAEWLGRFLAEFGPEETDDEPTAQQAEIGNAVTAQADGVSLEDDLVL